MKSSLMITLLVVFVATPLVVTGMFYLCESMPVAENMRVRQKNYIEDQRREAEEREKWLEAKREEEERQIKEENTDLRRKADNGDISALQILAERGDAKAQILLGIAYSDGKGVAKDEREAVEWYRKAAEQGHANGQLLLGTAYSDGKGVSKDEREAVKWWRKAAEQGECVGQFFLGKAYSAGKGVAKDEQEGVKWMRRAAEHGLAKAQAMVAVAYFLGEGVPKDMREATKWAVKADAQAQDLNTREIDMLDQVTQKIPAIGNHINSLLANGELTRPEVDTSMKNTMARIAKSLKQ